MFPALIIALIAVMARAHDVNPTLQNNSIGDRILQRETAEKTRPLHYGPLPDLGGPARTTPLKPEDSGLLMISSVETGDPQGNIDRPPEQWPHLAASTDETEEKVVQKELDRKRWENYIEAVQSQFELNALKDGVRVNRNLANELRTIERTREFSQ